jgi:hypothetical protein
VPLDLLVLILPYLSPSDGAALFDICLSTQITESKDNAVQKRGYKILAKLVESGKVSPDPQQVLQQMDSLLEGLTPAAKKVYRLLLCNLASPEMILSGSFCSPELACCTYLSDKLASSTFYHTGSRGWDKRTI